MRTIQPSPSLVHAEANRYTSIRRDLLARVPQIDDETLADTLEGITELRDMLAELIRSALDDQALVKALSTRIEDMRARIERFEVRASRKRQLVRSVMEQADLQKLTQADFTASLRKSAPAVDILEEQKIPAAYWKPQPPKLDRQAVLVALKNGAHVEGAALTIPEWQLSVRTK
jgi:hypothetical protein